MIFTPGVTALGVTGFRQRTVPVAGSIPATTSFAPSPAMPTTIAPTAMGWPMGVWAPGERDYGNPIVQASWSIP